MTQLQNPITDYHRLPITGFWRGRRVFITGHTGFKGSWLTIWLRKLGAKVYGFSLREPPSTPSHFELFAPDCRSFFGDIRNPAKLEKALQKSSPEIVFHLAAQPIVRLSYLAPVETFSTNLIGTLNLFEACRKTPSVKAIINITTDKCYENLETDKAYKEEDPLGGHDPYSSSKACSEILSSCYRKSFFNSTGILLATCRAGNVIGGGDWAKDRLIPDIMRATAKGEEAIIRNPFSIRPWQHVLDPLYGYIMLGEKLLNGDAKFATAWNFGPALEDCLTVEELVKMASREWKRIKYKFQNNSEQNFHEAKILKLDCNKAQTELGWKPVWNSAKAIKKTVEWYKNFHEFNTIKTLENIEEYESNLSNGN
ncbi:MAG: CDP-glucose 4,6-dehydratase [Candidatus Nanoarchaeia archaeon]